MSPNQIFSLVNVLALGGWVLLGVAPRRRWAADLVAGTVVPVLLAAVYVVIVSTQWAGSSGGFSSLPAVATL
ncbi:MAG: abscisic acid-deficient protein Aba4 family protein, partial [Vicinamibacterales bacterium]